MSKLANLKAGIPNVSLASVPGMAPVGKLVSKVGKPPAAVQSLMSGVGPLVLVVVLAVLNIVMFLSGGSSDEERAVWDGPLMTEKLFQLPDPSTAKIINTSRRKAKKKKIETQQLVTTDLPETTDLSDAGMAADEDDEIAYTKTKYVVQVGQFLTDSGVNSIIKTLQDRGYYPKVQVIQQKSFLNNVQAGPYASKEAARESEVKLRANGKNVKVETSEEGYFISLSKTARLSPALENMEKYDAMGIAPLRLIKAAQFKPVKSVYMGPYNSKIKAEEVKTRMAGISLAIPLVQEWKEDEE
ncbi:MAG: SPOR domain-containing protein [Magnetococcales bacterium]|nr:SPOR domain-containing protein [Magnetococcales bacterium]